MEVNEVVKNVTENEDVQAQMTELIEAGKDVVVDLNSDGTATVTEITKAGFGETYGPLIGFGLGCFLAGAGAGLGIKHLWEKHRAKKLNKEFEEDLNAKTNEAVNNANTEEPHTDES